eukprot:6989282-Alexandrium_andersonii.AAC.1
MALWLSPHRVRRCARRPGQEASASQSRIRSAGAGPFACKFARKASSTVGLGWVGTWAAVGLAAVVGSGAVCRPAVAGAAAVAP